MAQCRLAECRCLNQCWPRSATWRRYQMETFSALLVTGKFQHKGQWRGALIFSLICALNKRWSKQSWGCWLETPSSWLWCHCNDIATVRNNTITHTLPAKIWNIFHYSNFLHFCVVCRVFLYLKYIPVSRYYFWGSKLALNRKMKGKCTRTIISVFSQLDYG